MRKLLTIMAAIAGLAIAPAFAAELPAPTGKVILTITGAIENHSSEGKVEMDLEQLEALAGRETTATTPWYEGPMTFSGPLGTSLLDYVGSTGTMMKITAINDFVAEVPIEDLKKYPVIFATRLGGETIPVRSKGPIFVIYPFNEHAELNNNQIYSRSAWQVAKIEIY